MFMNCLSEGLMVTLEDTDLLKEKEGEEQSKSSLINKKTENSMNNEIEES